MLDFGTVRGGEITLDEPAAGLACEDLNDLTDEMVDMILDVIAAA
jgi:hypothetical protein